MIIFSLLLPISIAKSVSVAQVHSLPQILTSYEESEIVSIYKKKPIEKFDSVLMRSIEADVNGSDGHKAY